MNIHLKIVNRSERRDVCFMLQLLCSVFWHTAWTHLYLACLPCHSPAQRSLCAQHHPTCYQPVLMNTHMRYLSRPACLHTGSCLGVCVCYRWEITMVVIFIHLFDLFFLWLVIRMLFVGRTKEQPGEFEFESVWLVWQCSVAVVKK